MNLLGVAILHHTPKSIVFVREDEGNTKREMQMKKSRRYRHLLGNLADGGRPKTLDL
jgi:hypothetical protein